MRSWKRRVKEKDGATMVEVIVAFSVLVIIIGLFSQALQLSGRMIQRAESNLEQSRMVAKRYYMNGKADTYDNSAKESGTGTVSHLQNIETNNSKGSDLATTFEFEDLQGEIFRFDAYVRRITEGNLSLYDVKKNASASSGSSTTPGSGGSTDNEEQPVTPPKDIDDAFYEVNLNPDGSVNTDLAYSIVNPTDWETYLKKLGEYADTFPPEQRPHVNVDSGYPVIFKDGDQLYYIIVNHSMGIGELEGKTLEEVYNSQGYGWKWMIKLNMGDGEDRTRVFTIDNYSTENGGHWVPSVKAGDLAYIDEKYYIAKQDCIWTSLPANDYGNNWWSLENKYEVSCTVQGEQGK